ncbi:ATP-binding protein [Paenibacillus elgii]|uniref:ATP-binding protein n=1 Tax=Paenibacillus elgii TaxID=189691 RepID=UPI000248CA20|nr:ATP-binding protein [Paenibacillus elgii]
MNRPILPAGTHPIEQGGYILPTMEVKRLMESFMKVVNNRLPGMIVYGRPRIGKTKSVEFALSYLPAQLGTYFPVLKTRCKSYRHPTEEKFFGDMLVDFKFPFPSKQKAPAMRQQIVNLMLEQGERSKLRRVMLIIDEGQWLTEIHYQWLMDIYNDLDSEKISMTIILIGQTELLDRRTFFLEQKKAQIIGRFMTNEHEFYGIRSLEEVEHCLMCYDEVSEYPENSGCSYTRYFFTEAYDNGMRLKHCAKDVFNLFKSMRKEHGLTRKMEIPMEYFTFTVENALKLNGSTGNGGEWLTNNHWREAIQNSGYVESEIFMALA